jgi:hypothetical protein
MPTIMLILNVVFIAGAVLGIVGLLAWGIVTDRPFATARAERGMAGAARVRARRRAARAAGRAHRHGRPIGLGA